MYFFPAKFCNNQSEILPKEQSADTYPLEKEFPNCFEDVAGFSFQGLRVVNG